RPLVKSGGPEALRRGRSFSCRASQTGLIGGSSSPRVLGTHVRSNALRAFICFFSFGVDSVAQFVGRRKLRAGMDGRRAGASAAARSGRGARRGRAARSGSAARSIATRVRAGGYVAERGGHSL